MQMMNVLLLRRVARRVARRAAPVFSPDAGGVAHRRGGQPGQGRRAAESSSASGEEGGGENHAEA